MPAMDPKPRGRRKTPDNDSFSPDTTLDFEFLLRQIPKRLKVGVRRKTNGIRDCICHESEEFMSRTRSVGTSIGTCSRSFPILSTKTVDI